MSTFTSVLSSRRLNKWLPWISAAVLIAGLVTFLVVKAANTAEPQGPRVGAGPIPVEKAPKTVKLSPQVRKVAGQFILTAVARKQLAKSWNLVTPNLKRGYTLAEWKRGAIPVVPFPVDNLDRAAIKVDWSYARNAALEVALLSKSKKVKSQLFFIELKKIGKGEDARWLVDSWVPRASPQIPATLNN